MKRIVLVTAALIAGCAHHQNDAVDLNFYDYQWSKSGATKESWDRDKHDCEVEEHQRNSFDELKLKNARDLDNDMYETSRQTGTIYWGGSANAAMKGSAERAKYYWSQCMEARQWRIVDQKVLGTEDNDIERHTNSYKPPKESPATPKSSGAS